MSKTIALKIDVSKIDKNRLFKGQKGTYLDAVLLYNETPDQYGNNGMIVQSVSKEEREAGVKGAILGNGKLLGGPVTASDSFSGAVTASDSFSVSNNGSMNATSVDVPSNFDELDDDLPF